MHRHVEAWFIFVTDHYLSLEHWVRSLWGRIYGLWPLCWRRTAVSLLERNINLALHLERYQMKAEAWDGLMKTLPRVSGPVQEVMARPDPRSGNVLVFRKTGDHGSGGDGVPTGDRGNEGDVAPFAIPSEGPAPDRYTLGERALGRPDVNRPLKRGGPERPFDDGSGRFYATRRPIRGYVPVCRVCGKEGKFSGPDKILAAKDAGWRDCGWSYLIRDIYWRCPDCQVEDGGES